MSHGTHDKAKDEAPTSKSIDNSEVKQARSLEEGLAAAGNYEGDPLECPCIQHMKEGPCGGQFVLAYKCFLDSKEEEKGSDCIESFRAMQVCFQEHPDDYKDFLGGDDEDKSEDKESNASEQQDETKRLEWLSWNFAK